MNKILDIDFSDFYFNGKWLSDFDGSVAGRSGLTPLSTLPSLDIKTEKVMGRDGEFVYDARYNPRTFTIPVYFEDISRVREIANWLNTKKPSDLFFRGDNVKIKCMLDGVVDIEMYTYQGLTELKFIAHDPYFYEINEDVYIYSINGLTFDNELSNGKEGTLFEDNLIYVDKNYSFSNEITINNEGNVDSFPSILVCATTTANIYINDELIMSFGDMGVNELLVIDSEHCTISYNGMNKMGFLVSYDYDFPTLQSGENRIKISGSITSFEMKIKSRWI